MGEKGQGDAGQAIRIRDARPSDADRLARLIESLSESEGDPTGHVTPATVARDLAAGQIGIVVAEGEAGIVGYCLFHFGYEATYAASGLYIVDLYVVSERRRQGIARALVAEVARRAKAAGGVFVWWAAKPGNTAANAAYARLDAFAEPVIAHAVFDDSFERLVAEAEARNRPQG